MYPLVQIVVLNWNGFEDTLRCVRSLECQTYQNFRLVVIDNGSTEVLPEFSSTLGDRIEIVRLRENLGFTGGNNLAMQDAFNRGADYVWMFNNDAVAQPDVLAKLVAACEADPAIGLVSPLVQEPDGTAPNEPGSGCGLFSPGTPSYVHANNGQEAADWQRRFPDRLVVYGTALLVRRSLHQAIGGLDDQFFAYWEDIDYSIRSVSAGFRNAVVADALVHHLHKPMRTDPASIKPHWYYFMARNELLLWRKFFSGKKLAQAAYWALLRQLRQIVRMPGNVGGINAALGGFWHGCRGIGGRFDPARRMPGVLEALFRRYPVLWLRLLGGQTMR